MFRRTLGMKWPGFKAVWNQTDFPTGDEILTDQAKPIFVQRMPFMGRIKIA